MIRATDVRIGNYLAEANGKIFKVDPRVIYLLLEGTGPVWDGVAFTIDTLSKCGFIKETWRNCYFLNISEDLSLKYYPEVRIIQMCGLDMEEDLDHIKHLHDLQNFMYFITGKELSVSL